MKQWKVIFVGCHPDDIEIGCGGSVSLFVRLGFKVICVFLTRGEQAGDPAVREMESQRACQRLGVPAENIHWGTFPDTAVQDSHQTIAFLEQFAGGQVWGVFVPSRHETHQDHRHAAQACLSAFRRVTRILAYESPSVTPEFQPNAFIRIDGHLAHKWAALECHRSQIVHGNKMYLQYRSMIRMAEYRGQQNAVDYAEAFEALRFQIDPDRNGEACSPLNRRVSGPDKRPASCQFPGARPARRSRRKGRGQSDPSQSGHES